jgi:hypothetical protein
MGEAAAFEALVWAVTAVTAARALDGTTPRRSRAFLVACAAAQACAVAGLRTGRADLVRAAHVGFTAGVWVGALCLPRAALELRLVQALLVVTLATRRALGHCMFARARGSDATDDPRYDLVYAAPLLLSLAPT